MVKDNWVLLATSVPHLQVVEMCVVSEMSDPYYLHSPHYLLHSTRPRPRQLLQAQPETKSVLASLIPDEESID